MALTKADFAEQLFDELGLNKHTTKDLVALFFEEIKATLEQGEFVKISGLVNSSFTTKGFVPAGIQKQARKSPSLPDVLSPSNPGRD